MRARDIMQPEVITARCSENLAEVCDRMQEAHVHAAPVLDEEGDLVGIVSVEDLLYGGALARADEGDGPDEENGRGWHGSRTVGEVMTAPPFMTEDLAPLKEVCEMMWRYRVHHLPVVADGQLVGIISSLDVCRVLGIEPPQDVKDAVSKEDPRR